MMAERHRKCVGGIGRREFREPEEPAHHELNLFLRCAPLPHDRALHEARRVLMQLRAGLLDRQEHDTPGMPQHEGSTSRAGEERRLHRDGAHRVVLEHGDESGVDACESLGERRRLRSADDAGRGAREAVAVATDEPPSGRVTPRVDAEYQRVVAQDPSPPGSSTARSGDAAGIDSKRSA